MSVVFDRATLEGPSHASAVGASATPLPAAALEPLVEIAPADEDSRFVIRPSSTFSRYWDLLILCVLLCVGIMTPYEVAFLSHEDSHDPGAAAVNALTIIVEIIFFVDIVLHFFTGILDPSTQEEILSQRVIVRHYLHGRFWLDLVTVIPWDKMAKGQDAATLRLLRMLWLVKFVKLLRALRVNILFRRVTVRWGLSTMSVSVAKYVVVVILLTHWAACTLQLVAVLEAGASSTSYVFFLALLQEGSFLPFMQIRITRGRSKQASLIARRVSSMLLPSTGPPALSPSSAG